VSHYYITTKNSAGEWTSSQVPREVYIYVKQLEYYIRYPEESGLLKLYKDRFAGTRHQSKEIKQEYRFYSSDGQEFKGRD
jgi:hypothetical protein